MITTNDRSTATVIHLSTLTQYFIPFGNIIFPVVIWSALKSKSNYIDEQGRRAINFQLSIFLYSIILTIIAVPILIVNVLKGIQFSEMYRHHNGLIRENFDPQNMSTIVIVAIVAVIVFCILKVMELLLVIVAAVKTSNGENYNYPITINFLGSQNQESLTQSSKESNNQTT